MLNMKEKEKYEMIKKVEDKILTRKEASYQLNLSLKQIDRLRKIYNLEGEMGFVHKNRGKSNPNKKDGNMIKELERLYLTEYFDYNFEHFLEEIQCNYKDEFEISYAVMFKEFKRDDIVSPLAHKATVKLYNEKMSKAIKSEVIIEEEILELYNSRQIAFEQAHVRRSSNLYVFGEEVQMDACEKRWFGGVVTHLHLAVDKGTKKALFGWFEYGELTRGYFVVLYHIILNYGIPDKVKTDNRKTFSNNKNEVDTTQFGMICEALGIELITTSVATSKANVERKNKTFKDRLIAELRHENITTIEPANEYLNNIFIPKMDKKFSYKIDENTSKMKPNNYSEEELNLIISEKFMRTIDNASSIKYENKYYIPVNPTTGEVTCFMTKTECQVIITYNAEYWCRIEGNYYQLKELENRDITMEKETEDPVKKEKHKYIPPKNHPWRKT